MVVKEGTCHLSAVISSARAVDSPFVVATAVTNAAQKQSTFLRAKWVYYRHNKSKFQSDATHLHIFFFIRCLVKANAMTCTFQQNMGHALLGHVHTHTHIEKRREGRNKRQNTKTSFIWRPWPLPLPLATATAHTGNELSRPWDVYRLQRRHIKSSRRNPAPTNARRPVFVIT